MHGYSGGAPSRADRSKSKKHYKLHAGLDIGLVGPVARGASRFEKLLAPQKTYWPPQKRTGPYLKTKLARRKNICVNLQFAHRPIIKLFIMLVYRLMILHHTYRRHIDLIRIIYFIVKLFDSLTHA